MEPFSRNPSKISTNRSYKKGASLWLAVRFIRVIQHERKKEKWKRGGGKSHRKCLAAIAQRLASLCEIDQLCSKLRFILIDCILKEIEICIDTKNTRDSYYLLRLSYVSNVVSSSCFLKCSSESLYLLSIDSVSIERGLRFLLSYGFPVYRMYYTIAFLFEFLDEALCLLLTDNISIERGLWLQLSDGFPAYRTCYQRPSF